MSASLWQLLKVKWLFVSMLLAACITTPQTMVKAPLALPLANKIVENAGELCFQPTWQQTGNWIEITKGSELAATISPGCFSSSCTEIMEQTGAIRIDQASQAFYFQSRFRFLADLGSDNAGRQVRACTADCGGGGSLMFNRIYFNEGVYSIWWGNKMVGKITVPSNATQSERCFQVSNQQ